MNVHDVIFFIIIITIIVTGWMAAKFQEKMEKYTDLKFEVRKMWWQPVSVVPVGALGSVPPTSLKLLASSVKDAEECTVKLHPHSQKTSN